MSHHGKNPNAGHYTADVRQPDGRWLRFDDASVTSVPLSMVRHLPTLQRKRCLASVSAVCLLGRGCSLSHPVSLPFRCTHACDVHIHAASACDEAHLFDFVQVLNDQAYLLFYSKAR